MFRMKGYTFWQNHQTPALFSAWNLHLHFKDFQYNGGTVQCKAWSPKSSYWPPNVDINSSIPRNKLFKKWMHVYCSKRFIVANDLQLLTNNLHIWHTKCYQTVRIMPNHCANISCRLQIHCTGRAYIYYHLHFSCMALRYLCSEANGNYFRWLHCLP